MWYDETETRAYVKRRFPRATKGEHEKLIQDWLTKQKQSEGIVEDFERRIGSVSGQTILDVGSGNGGISIAFAQRGADVRGVEIEEDLTQIARTAAERADVSVPFICYDGTTLTFPDASFDAAVSVSVLEHVDNPTRYLSEIRRVLKPGGSLYLAFPNRLNPKETHTGLWGLSYLPVSLARAYVRIAGRNPLEDNGLHFYSYWAVHRLLKSAALDWRVKNEPGMSAHPLKVLVKSTLRMLGIPHQAFLPHVMLVIEVPRRPELQ